MLGASLSPTASFDDVAVAWPVQAVSRVAATPAAAMAAKDRVRCFVACVIAFFTFVVVVVGLRLE
ncbi:hypothetical protein ARTHRO9AX_80168 [Arthrobacter sp. 9AX]|nr:hypothetical protein ARTHRO9AX_80168 [Arthrobacter sp. 9AX]